MKTMYVYILKCSDGSYYTGVTNNLETRLLQHKEGTNKESFTYNRRPFELVFYELFSSPELAIQFEKKLKKWTRVKKEALINNNWEKLKELAICQNYSHSKNNQKNVDTSTPLSVTSI